MSVSLTLSCGRQSGIVEFPWFQFHAWFFRRFHLNLLALVHRRKHTNIRNESDNHLGARLPLDKSVVRSWFTSFRFGVAGQRNGAGELGSLALGPFRNRQVNRCQLENRVWIIISSPPVPARLGRHLAGELERRQRDHGGLLRGPVGSVNVVHLMGGHVNSPMPLESWLRSSTACG